MSHPDENDFQEVILSDDENTQTQNQQSNNQVRSRALEMRTIYSNDNLILDTQISSDVLSDYGGSMYSPQFRNNSHHNEHQNEHPNTHPNSSKLQYVCIFMNHVMMQIALLSILEPVLFFYYIVSMEKGLFYEQLDSFVIHTFDVFDETMVAKIRNQVFYPLIFDFLNYENVEVDDFYLSLEDDAEKASYKQQQLVDSLFEKAFQFAIVCNTINVAYSLFLMRVYKTNMFEMLGHHVLLISCIGLYEIWFFTTIVLNYLPWTKEEILFYIFQCIWLEYSEKFPELKELQHNVTMSCTTS